MSFNRDFAAKYFDIVSKMDDDSAAMFQRMVVHGVLMDDLENNRRTVSKAVGEILGEIREEVSKSLQSREGQPEAHATAALVGMVSKASDWERRHHEPRDKSGRWTVNFSASKEKTQPHKGQHVHIGDFDVTNALKTTGEETNRFAQKWNERGQDEYSTTSGMYNRISAGSHVLSQMGDATGNPKLALAGRAGEFLGQYGPQAEQVIGPHMRKTAYRYRGTERVPDRALAAAQREQITAIGRREGLTSNEQFTTPMMNTASHLAAINYLRGRLPDKRLAELQQKSGKIPPSEGVIINADGKIITQAVGYMDDHYMPFNLKNLKGLQGGSYVRTRSSGGLTTEDIYTGLMTGARSATVVSRSGIFTVNFEDDFRGGRRYNDKAHGMVNRYAKTLDAVQSKQVTRRPLSMEDRLKIRSEVEEEMYGFKPAEIEEEIKRRSTEAATRPTISQSEMNEINQKAKEAADMGGQGPRIQLAPREWERIKNDPVKREMAYKQQMIEDVMREKEATKFQLDGEGYAVALDALREQFPYYIQSVEYIHNKDPKAVGQGFSPETDSGYVKAKYNRPAGASEGWFDESIGHKKISADQTGYQNWRTRKGGLTPVTTAVDEDGKPKEEAPKRAATAAEVKDKIARGRKEAAINEEYRGVMRELQNVDLSDHKDAYPLVITAQRDPDALERILGDPIRSKDFDQQVRNLTDTLAETDNEAFKKKAESMRTRLKTVDAHKVVVGGEQWDPNKYTGAASPAQPWEFKDGNEYLSNQNPAVYRQGWANQAHHLANLIHKDYNLTPGQDLRSAATTYGRLYALADAQTKDKKDSADLMGPITRALPQASEETINNYAHAIANNADQARERFGRIVEHLERARRIEAVAGDALKEQPAEEAPAAGQVIQGTAHEVVHVPHPETKEEEPEETKPRSNADIRSGLLTGLGHWAQRLRSGDDVNFHLAENTTRARRDLSQTLDSIRQGIKDQGLDYVWDPDFGVDMAEIKTHSRDLHEFISREVAVTGWTPDRND